jgi:hypothetical protein
VERLASCQNRLDNSSYTSAAKSPSSNTSAGFYAKTFGVSLAVVWTFCLVLTAASSSTPVNHQSARDLATTGAIPASALRRVVPTLGRGSHAAPFCMNLSKVCAKTEDGRL